MKNSPLPDSDNISRYCSYTRIAPDGSRPMPAAFKLRKKQNFIEEYLSVDWLEFHDAHNRDKQIEGVREMFKKRGRALKASAKFAVLNVKKVKKMVRDRSQDHREITITHQPSNPEDSHGGIFNTNHTNSELLIATILAESVYEMHPAVSGPNNR